MNDLTATDGQGLYTSIDSALSEWEKLHGTVFLKLFRDDEVRTIWLSGKVQIWVDPPDAEGYVTLNASELKQELPSKWGRSLKTRVEISQVSNGLSEIWNKAQSWL